MSLRRKTTYLCLSAALVATGVTACASSGSGSSASACDTPGITRDQVNLGLIVSDSGAGSAAFASVRSGVDARIGLANQEGGVHGRKVVYEWRDDANSTPRNDEVTNELISRDSTFGLITVTTSVGSGPQRLAERNIPVVGLALPTMTGYQNMFGTMYSASPATVGRYIQANGGTKVGVVMTGVSPTTVTAIANYRTAFASIGLATTDTVQYSSATDSPARVAQNLAAAGVDSLIAFTIPSDLAAILQAGQAANLSLAATVSFTGYDRTTLPALGRQLAGVSMPVYHRPFEAGGPAFERYRSAMNRFAPESPQTDERYALNAFVYTDMFLQGLELAGDCPTRQGFIDTLRKVSDYDAGGLIESINLGTNATEALSCYAFVQVKPDGTGFGVSRQRLCADGTGS